MALPTVSGAGSLLPAIPMSNDRTREGAAGDTGGAGDEEHAVPCLPPIEITKEGDDWLLAQYAPNSSPGSTIDRLPTRMDAMRAAKDLMDDHAYPCMVMWAAPGKMQDAYWNPLFEQLNLVYDPMLEAWAVVPEEGYYVFAVDTDKALAREHAREIQLEYDFKRLVVYRKDGNRQQSAGHHFIQSI